MSNSLIGFSAIGDSNQPSPSIWSDCPNTLLPDKGLGYFVNQDFLGDYTTGAAAVASGIASDADIGSTFAQAASSTYGPNVISPAVTNTDNNALALLTAEIGQIVRNSGKKVWFEARVAVGALGDSGLFVGLTTLANATRDVVANDPSNSAVAGLTAASLIGFVTVQASSKLATVNAVYSSGAGSPVTVVTDVLASPAITAAGGTLTPLAANAFHKFGVRFDGYTKLHFYVDGYRVASQEVDSTFDQTSYYVAVVAQKTGAATAVTNYVDFIRVAAQLRA